MAMAFTYFQSVLMDHDQIVSKKSTFVVKICQDIISHLKAGDATSSVYI